MNNRRARALAVALGIAAGGMTPTVAAHAAPLFNGTYTAVRNGQSSIWIVSSSCALMACQAHVVNKVEGSDWIFTGTQWSRLALPLTGTCNGATVPARAAQQFLVPRSDGTLAGAVALR